MKTLGIIGGMTPASTAIYYTKINDHVNKAKGGSTSAPLIIHSVDHSAMLKLFGSDDWAGVVAVFTSAATHMKDAGAGAIAIGCNIGHKVAAEVEQGAGLPVLHIADWTAAEVRAQGLKKIGLLATLPAMEQGFIGDRLVDKVGGGLEVIVPEREERLEIQNLIATELSAGIASDNGRVLMKKAVEGLVARGADGVVLACTDLQFVLSQEDVSVPVIDTLELHAKGLADWILEED